LLRAIEQDQRPLSRSAVLAIRVDYPVKRKSLRSGELGTRIYPLRFDGSLESDGTIHAVLGATITYSSSCPCSASLAHRLLREQFLGRFGQLEKLTVAEILEWLDSEDGTLPVPHSQRSRAEVSAEVDWTRPTIDHLELIDLAERTLGTPVQAAVKRVDEQEFARLNGLNPLFCEDAVRRLAAALARDARIRAYRVGVRHEESLHAHDAVAEVASDTWPTGRHTS
jgi:GTP cyclohydrolase I